MRPSTRSSALNNPLYISETSHTVQITHTLDPIQKKFKTSPEYLPFWRYVMYQRYIGQYKPQNLVTSWENKGPKHSPKETTPVLKPSEIPDDLAQSTIRLTYKIPNEKLNSKSTTKSLTITIYYTTGRVLMQGKACSVWVEEELQTLVALVHTLYSRCNTNVTDNLTTKNIIIPGHELTKSIMCEHPESVKENVPSSSKQQYHPVNALTDQSFLDGLPSPPPFSPLPSLSPQVTSPDPTTPHHPQRSPHPPASVTLNLNNSTPQENSTAKKDPTLTPTPGSAQSSESASTPTPYHPTLDFKSSESEVGRELTGSTAEPPPAPSRTLESSTLSTCKPVSTPTSSRPNVEKMQSDSPVTQLPPSPQELTTSSMTKHALTVISPEQPESVTDNQKSDSVSNTTLQSSSAPSTESTVSASETQTDFPQCQCDCVPLSIFQQVTSSLRDEIAALRSSLKQMSERQDNDIDHLETLVKYNHPKGCRALSTSSTSPKDPHSRRPAKHSPAGSGSEADIKTCPTHQSVPSPKTRAPVSNTSKVGSEASSLTSSHAIVDLDNMVAKSTPSFSATLNAPQSTTTSDTTVNPTTGTSDDFSTSSKKNSDHSLPFMNNQSTASDPNVHPTSSDDLSSPSEEKSHQSSSLKNNNPLSQNWPELSISPNTSTILLGDSVFTGLHESKMAVRREPTQVLALPGLDRASLMNILRGTKPQPNVTTVVIHVGINDCIRGHVLGNGAWRNIIFQATRTFPKAQLSLSSILPHRDQHAHFSACIMDSNKAMQLSSKRFKAKFIDNDSTFFFEDGRVKSGWMRDQIHPNGRGSSGLAVNIKRSYSAHLHPSAPRITHPLLDQPPSHPQQYYYHNRNSSNPIPPVRNQSGNHRQHGYHYQSPSPLPLLSSPQSTGSRPSDGYLPPHNNQPNSCHHPPFSSQRRISPILPTSHSNQCPTPSPPASDPMSAKGSYAAVTSGKPHVTGLTMPQPAHSEPDPRKPEPINLTVKQRQVDVQLLMDLLGKLIQ